ncbi:hypothetical protein V6N13_134951 [Hibiscus sabdariffa]
MPPPTEGFFTGAFQPYSSMMAAPSILLDISTLLHYQCIHRRVLPSVLAMGWCTRHPQVLYLPLDRVGAVITQMTTLMTVRRTTTILNYLFEEIPPDIVVHQIVGRGT